jgi:hypothetical protein
MKEFGYIFSVDYPVAWDGVKCYLLRYKGGEVFEINIDETGCLVETPHDINSVYAKPFLTLNMRNNEILQAIADGLAKVGVVAEVDNKQRIVAEALAEERKGQVQYYKQQNEDILNKLLNKVIQ